MSPTRGSAAPWARRWAPALLWGGVILVMTSWPSLSVGIDVDWTDEVAHFGVYTILGWLSARAMLEPRDIGRLMLVGAVIAVFAALDELHQIWIPNRFATVADWLADVLGAATGLVTYHLTQALRQRRSDLTT